jgi:hypothetical protein
MTGLQNRDRGRPRSLCFLWSTTELPNGQLVAVKHICLLYGSLTEACLKDEKSSKVWIVACTVVTGLACIPIVTPRFNYNTTLESFSNQNIKWILVEAHWTNNIHVFFSEPLKDLFFILPILSKCGIIKSECPGNFSGSTLHQHKLCKHFLFQ